MPAEHLHLAGQECRVNRFDRPVDGKQVLDRFDLSLTMPYRPAEVAADLVELRPVSLKQDTPVVPTPRPQEFLEPPDVTGSRPTPNGLGGDEVDQHVADVILLVTGVEERASMGWTFDHPGRHRTPIIHSATGSDVGPQQLEVPDPDGVRCARAYSISSSSILMISSAA